MNELNCKIKQNNNEINNKKNKNNTKKEKPNRTPNTTLWNQNKYDVGVWSKNKFRTTDNLDNNQYPILMVDKIPSNINNPPQEIKLSTQSTISNITNEKQYKRKINKVDEFLSKWKNAKETIKTTGKEQTISKKQNQKEQNKSKRLQYMKKEKSNDKETGTKILYKENVAKGGSGEGNSKYDSEEIKDSDEEIKRTSIEIESIHNKPSIQLISNIPPTKRILLTTQRTLVYKYSC